VLNAHIITPAESFPVVVACASRNMRMTKFIAVVHIWRTVVLIVLASTLNPVVETLAADLILEILRRRIPSTRPISARRRRRRPLLILRLNRV